MSFERVQPTVSFVHVSGSPLLCLRMNTVVLKKMELVVPSFTHVETSTIDGNLKLTPVKLLGYPPYQRTKLLRLSTEICEDIEVTTTLLKMPTVYRSGSFIVQL